MNVLVLFIVDHSIGPRDALAKMGGAGVTSGVMGAERTSDAEDAGIK